MCGNTRVLTSGTPVAQGMPQDTTPTRYPFGVVNGPPESPMHVPLPCWYIVQNLLSRIISRDLTLGILRAQSRLLMTLVRSHCRLAGWPLVPHAGFWKRKITIRRVIDFIERTNRTRTSPQPATFVGRFKWSGMSSGGNWTGRTFGPVWNGEGVRSRQMSLLKVANSKRGWLMMRLTAWRCPPPVSRVVPALMNTLFGWRRAPCVQWAADNTQVEEMMVPPQKCTPFWRRSDTSHGNWPALAVDPPRIRLSTDGTAQTTQNQTLNGMNDADNILEENWLSGWTSQRFYIIDSIVTSVG